MEIPLKNPNLPAGRVRSVLISGDADWVLPAIEALGIRPVTVPPCGDLPAPVRSHPDMLFHHLGGRDLVVYYKIADRMRPVLSGLGFRVIPSERPLTGRYPGDIALNAARAGHALLCSIKNTDKSILASRTAENRNLIDVRQGYAKCSTLVADEKSLITSDPAIAGKAEANGFRVLKITPGFIRLPGYGYGFIGGCCGKIAADTIVFSGKIEDHPDYIKMKGFLGSIPIKMLSLSEKPLFDVGGVLPLTEETETL